MGELLNILIDFPKSRKKRVVLNDQSSGWVDVKASVPQGSTMGPFFSFINLYQLFSECLNTDANLFADKTSLFPINRDINASTEELNNDLLDISKEAYQWKMIFNTYLTKQEQEVIFSRKINKTVLISDF